MPKELASVFDIEWLPILWDHQGTILVRPTEIFSPENYSKLIKSFQISLPQYLYKDEYLDRWMITIPKDSISETYIPSRQFMKIMQKKSKNPLEEKALELLNHISKRSGLSRGFLGIHGSISLGTYHDDSDIDLSVYGAENYRLVKSSLKKLEEEGFLSLKRENKVEAKRLNRGEYLGEDFVINATRKFCEIGTRHPRYRPLCIAELSCICTNAEQSCFRPAIYRVRDCRSVGSINHEISEVSEVISMIGLYRDVVEEGEEIRARGVIEEVTIDGETRLRLVVGTTQPNEYIDWL